MQRVSAQAVHDGVMPAGFARHAPTTSGVDSARPRNSCATSTARSSSCACFALVPGVSLAALPRMRRRSLLPREHGAYFQLGIPLVAAFCARAPSFAGAALGIAAILAFFAHEPLAILLGGRGARAARVERGRAVRVLAILVPLLLAMGIGGLATAPSTAVAFALGSASCGVIVATLASRRREHSLAGELLAAVALTGASATVLVADGAAVQAGLAWWVGWSVGFALTVIGVHRVIARHNRLATTVDRLFAVGIAASTVGLGTVPDVAFALPLGAVATAITFAPPNASRLRRGSRNCCRVGA
jgi:hypothetical protein